MNSKINLDNYEEYALEYADGELREPLLSEMERFLAAHPAIRKEIMGAAAVVVTPDLSVKYPNKQQLYQPVAAPWWKWGSIALLLLLFLGWGVWFWSAQPTVGLSKNGTGRSSVSPVQVAEPTTAGASVPQPSIGEANIQKENIQNTNFKKEDVQNKKLDNNGAGAPAVKIPAVPFFKKQQEPKKPNAEAPQQDSLPAKPLIFANATEAELKQEGVEAVTLSNRSLRGQLMEQRMPLVFPYLPKLQEPSPQEVAVSEQPNLRRRLRDALLPEAITDNSAPKVKAKIPKIHFSFD